MDTTDRQKALSDLAEVRSDLLLAYGQILRQKEDLNNALWLAREAGVATNGVILADGIHLSAQNLEMLANQAADELERVRGCIDDIGRKIAQMQPN